LTQATLARRLGNHLPNGLATYLTGCDPDLTSGGRPPKHLRGSSTCRPPTSTPTTTTLASQGGYNVALPIDARVRVGSSRSGCRDGAKFVIALKVVTFSPRDLLPNQWRLAVGLGYAA
jgi:hypothetical protein